MVVAGLEMVETHWVVVGTGALDPERGVVAREVDARVEAKRGTESGAERGTERGAVAREEGVRVAAAVPVAHRKVFPGGALATEGVG